MDREEADKKARLAPPPTKQGWLHKKGGTALSAERKRWFVLQGAGSEATLRYSKEVNAGHRGTIRCEDIRGVVQDDNTLDIYTPDRTYHVRASSEQSAGVSQVNKAISNLDQMTQQNVAMVEQSTAASHSLSQEADGLNAAVARFQVGAVRPARAAVPAAPKHRPVVALKTVGRGGAALAPVAAPDADGWESF